MSLRKFGSVIVETDDISMMIGDMLFMKNGKAHNIDGASANAMREAFTPPQPTSERQGVR